MVGDEGFIGTTEPGGYWTLLYFNLVDQVLGQMRLPPEMLIFDDSDGKLLYKSCWFNFSVRRISVCDYYNGGLDNGHASC